MEKEKKEQIKNKKYIPFYKRIGFYIAIIIFMFIGAVSMFSQISNLDPLYVDSASVQIASTTSTMANIPKMENLDTQNLATENSLAEVVAEWESRVVLIVCTWVDPISGKLAEAGRGSGTLGYFGNDGFSILTNKHVLEYDGYAPSQCNVLFPSIKDYTIYSNDIARGIIEDWGSLKLPNDPFLLNFTTKGFKKCSLDSVKIGDKLVILGFPAIGADNSITATEGIVSGIDKNYYITSAKIEGGNSGGAAILVKDSCYLGIPSASMVGEIESMGRILKASFVIN